MSTISKPYQLRPEAAAWREGLRQAMRATMRGLKNDGIVAMSMDNFRMIVRAPDPFAPYAPSATGYPSVFADVVKADPVLASFTRLH